MLLYLVPLQGRSLVNRETDHQRNMMIPSNAKSVARWDIVMRTVGTVMESLMVGRKAMEAMVVEAVAMAMAMAEVMEEIKDVRIVRMNWNLKKHHHQQNHRRK